MQWILFKLGWILQSLLGTTVCESVNAAGNIFLGMSESPLVIKPFIKKLTKSEIHAIMVSGFRYFFIEKNFNFKKKSN